MQRRATDQATRYRSQPVGPTSRTASTVPWYHAKVSPTPKRAHTGSAGAKVSAMAALCRYRRSRAQEKRAHGGIRSAARAALGAAPDQHTRPKNHGRKQPGQAGPKPLLQQQKIRHALQVQVRHDQRRRDPLQRPRRGRAGRRVRPRTPFQGDAAIYRSAGDKLDGCAVRIKQRPRRRGPRRCTRLSLARRTRSFVSNGPARLPALAWPAGGRLRVPPPPRLVRIGGVQRRARTEHAAPFDVT